MNRRIPTTLALSALLVAVAGCSDGGDDPARDPTIGVPSVSSPPAGDDGVDASGALANPGTVIDRMGRPGITTALIDASDTKDAYNANVDRSTWDMAFFEPMTERLRIIDGLDGTMGDALLNDTDTLAELLLDDRLWIDTSRPTCDAYLSIEIGLQEGGCGGRTLRRDVIDDTLRHLVSQTMPLSDLADDDSTLLTDFPFLGPPNRAALAEPRP